MNLWLAERGLTCTSVLRVEAGLTCHADAMILAAEIGASSVGGKGSRWFDGARRLQRTGFSRQRCLTIHSNFATRGTCESLLLVNSCTFCLHICEGLCPTASPSECVYLAVNGSSGVLKFERLLALSFHCLESKCGVEKIC